MKHVDKASEHLKWASEEIRSRQVRNGPNVPDELRLAEVSALVALAESMEEIKQILDDIAAAVSKGQ
mgnify:FL=1